VALGGFAATVWLTAEAWPPWMVLVVAVATWMLVGVAGWSLAYAIVRSRG